MYRCPSKVRVPLSEDEFRRPGDLDFSSLWALKYPGFDAFEGFGYVLHSGFTWILPRFCEFSPYFLRDETAVGRGVHRFWGVPIQKSRSLFGPFSHFSPNFGIFGVGVIY